MSYVKKPLEELDVMDDFLMNQLASDEATKEIHSYVKQVKIQPEVKLAYMRYEEIIYYERKEAAEEAAEEAIKNIISVCRDLNATQETAAKQLAEKYSLSLSEAEKKVRQYWT